MRKGLILIGKTIVVLLYYGLIALFIWLFYDEWLTEHHWRSICFCIFSFLFGLGLKPFLLEWLYEEELWTYAENHEMESAIIQKVGSYVAFISLGFGGLSLLAGVLGEFLVVILLGMFQIICNTWLLWIIILFLFLISWALRLLRKFPLFRVFSKILFRLSLLSSIALIVYIDINMFELNGSVLSACVVLSIFSIYLFYRFYQSIKGGVLSFSHIRYALFLRAFQDDNDISTSSLYDLLTKTVKLPVMKIGNPTNQDELDPNEHFLPLSNWKFFLRFYMRRAKVIIMVTGTSDGIIWEMMQNVKYLDKCVIHFASREDLIKFKDELLLRENDNLNLIVPAIDIVLKKKADKNAFIIRNGNIFIDDACVLVNSVLEDNLKENGERIYINHNSSSVKQSNTKYLLQTFHILDLVNSIEALHNFTIRGTLDILVHLLVMLFMIATFLLGLIMIVGPIFIWLDPEYDTLSVVGKIWLSCVIIGMGVSFIRGIFD